MFSIIIPTFNNLEYLQLCLGSLEKNSKFKHEIIVHVNEGTDGTLDYIIKKKLKHTYTKNNVGLCTATNLASLKASTDYILYSHDDMYFCPGWDIALNNEINELNTYAYYISGTMIERTGGHIQIDCGSDQKNFDENKLLKNFNNKEYFNHQGSHWAPHLIHRSFWKKIGGFSEEFNPGIGSDPDLNMKLWKSGVRIFKGLSKFRVYHFSSISLRKKTSNNGAKTFLLKWGISTKFFKKHYLRSATKYNGPLTSPEKNLIYYYDLFKTKLKYLYLMFTSRLINEKSNSKNF